VADETASEVICFTSRECGGQNPGQLPVQIMKYYTDRKRHLVCVPYSIENLHEMARRLDIKRCWFHKDHYDIPKRRQTEIEAVCEIVSSKKIVEIIRKGI